MWRTLRNDASASPRPHMSGLEQASADEVFTSNWIAPLGAQLDAFEADPSTGAGQGSPRPWARPTC
jgi:hypothetical protein